MTETLNTNSSNSSLENHESRVFESIVENFHEDTPPVDEPVITREALEKIHVLGSTSNPEDQEKFRSYRQQLSPSQSDQLSSYRANRILDADQLPLDTLSEMYSLATSPESADKQKLGEKMSALTRAQQDQYLDYYNEQNQISNARAEVKNALGEQDASQEKLSTIQERHPDWPKLDILFYFSPHATSSDFEGIRPHLREADIYLYEDANNNTEARRTLQEVSLSPTIERSELKGGPMQPVIDEVYGSGKIISSIDLRDTKEERKLAHDLFEAFGKKSKSESLQEATGQFRNQLERIVKLQQQREAIMADRFEEEIETLLVAHPELKQKSDLKILLSMGSYHTTLRHTFSEKGIPSERQFSTPHIHTYPYEAQIQRELAYGKEPTQDLLERGFVEGLIVDKIGKGLRSEISSDDETLYGRFITSKLNHEHMENIYSLYAQDKLTVKALDSLFESIGLPKFPTSKSELDKYLHKNGEQGVTLAT